MSYCRLPLAAGLIVLLGAPGVQAQSTAAQNAMAPQTLKAVTMMGAAVPCSDLERSIAFYTKGLGMTLGGRMEMGTVTEAPLMFPGGGPYLILMKPKAEETALPVRDQLSRIILAVPDVKALEERLNAAGYHLTRPIAEEPKFRVAVGVLVDPDGNYLELVQRNL